MRKPWKQTGAMDGVKVWANKRTRSVLPSNWRLQSTIMGALSPRMRAEAEKKAKRDLELSQKEGGQHEKHSS